MELILSFMAVGSFCVVAAIIEAFLGSEEPSSNYKLGQSKRQRRSRS
jgi:hypothetical protein